MLLLSWLGTLLMTGPAGGVAHGPLCIPSGQASGVPLRVALEAPPDGIAASGLPGVMLEAAHAPGLVYVRHGAADLWPDPRSDAVLFRRRNAERPVFMLLTDTALDDLRLLLGQNWAVADEPAHIRLDPHFVLLANGHVVDLLRDWPQRVPLENGDIGWQLRDAAGDIVALAAAASAAPRHVLARQRAAFFFPPPAADAAALHASPAGQLSLDYGPELILPPVTACNADAAWLFADQAPYPDPMCGAAHMRPALWRQPDQIVALGRHAEGIVFDEQGIVSEAGYLLTLQQPELARERNEAGLMLRAGRMVFDGARLQNAPRVTGPHAVFTSANLSNYAHWLIDSLAHLFMMAPLLPPGTRLLLPGTLAALQSGPSRIIDHRETLALCGFGDLPVTVIGEEFCLAEDVFWLDCKPDAGQIPAAALQQFRAHVLALHPPPVQTGRKIFIARPHSRRIANEAALMGFLAKQEFERHTLHDKSFAEQVALFAGADFVVGVHGAELANLLFCPPGTRVLEIAPDDRFRPYFSYMSSKLGLAHGVLPAQLLGSSFMSDVLVDVPRLAALFRMLKHRV